MSSNCCAFLDMNASAYRELKNEKAHQSQKKNHSIVSGLLFSINFFYIRKEKEQRRMRQKRT